MRDNFKLITQTQPLQTIQELSQSFFTKFPFLFITQNSGRKKELSPGFLYPQLKILPSYLFIQVRTKPLRQLALMMLELFPPNRQSVLSHLCENQLTVYSREIKTADTNKSTKVPVLLLLL